MTETPPRCFEPLPRERWAGHARFPTQALLLGSHESFRQFSLALVSASPRDGAAGAGELVGHSLDVRQRLFERWQSAMRSHEHYEEHKLYPFLRHRFGVKTDHLQAGHEALHAIERDLRAAFEESDGAAWAIAMARYDRVLDGHLREEEDLVIPCLLALEPREFRAYYDGSPASVLRAPACAC